MKKGWTFALGLSSVILAVIAVFLYFVLAKPATTAYALAETAGTLHNPVYPLTTAEARAAFNSTFVLYLMYAVEAYNLHAPPLSTDVPRLNLFVDEKGYGITVKQGTITVVSQPHSSVDIEIHTTLDEAIRLLRDTSHIPASFQEGRSRVTFKVGSATLLSKGYMHVYRRLFSSSLTGNVIRMTFD